MINEDFKFDSFKYIEHEENADIVEKIRKRFKTAGILELVTELDHMENEPNLDKEIQITKQITIKRLIAIKLGLFDNEHAEYMIDTLPGYIETNARNIKKLEKTYKAHRHEKDRAFSSVPVE